MSILAGWHFPNGYSKIACPVNGIGMIHSLRCGEYMRTTGEFIGIDFFDPESYLQGWIVWNRRQVERDKKFLRANERLNLDHPPKPYPITQIAGRVGVAHNIIAGILFRHTSGFSPAEALTIPLADSANFRAIRGRSVF